MHKLVLVDPHVLWADSLLYSFYLLFQREREREREREGERERKRKKERKRDTKMPLTGQGE